MDRTSRRRKDQSARSGDVRSRKVDDWRLRAAVVSLSVLTVGLFGSVLWLLNREPNDVNRIVIAGLAGGASSSIALLMRSGGLTEVRHTLNTVGFLAIGIPAIGGFAAGSFSTLTGITLLVPRVPEFVGPSLASCAVFGGLYGLLLGGWVNQILSDQPASKLSDSESALATALTQLGGPLGVSGPQRYMGWVWAEWQPIQGKQLVVGNLLVSFQPTIASSEKPSPPPDAIAGPVQIPQGADMDDVSFDIAILSSDGLSVYPPSLSVRIPQKRPSEIFEFTLTRDRVTTSQQQDITNEATGDESSPSPVISDEPSPSPVVLVDISQFGRTTQVLEVPIRHLS